MRDRRRFDAARGWGAAALLAIGAAGQVIQLGTVPQGPPAHAVRAVPFGSIPSADRMSYLHHAGDGSGRVFLSTQNGQVWVFDAAGNRDATPFLDLVTALPGRFRYVDIGANGVRGFAFHPEYAVPGAPGEGVFYTAHSEHFRADGPGGADFPLDPNWIIDDGRPDSRHDSVVAAWRLDAGTGRIDASSYQVVLRVEQPFFDHPICQIAFDPTVGPGDPGYGDLFVGFGDGGGLWSGIPDFNRNLTGQDTRNVLASVLRIHPNPGSPGYDVPADNPFVGVAGAADEIYAFGFRHPQTMSFDVLTGRLLMADIGENNFEEVVLIEPGANYGWGVREGTYRFRDADLPPDGTRDDNALIEVPLADRLTDGFTYPVAQYDHINVNPYGGDAICGGFVYHGARLPWLTGRYLFGNFSNDDVFYVDSAALVNDGQPAVFHELPFVDDQGRPTNLQTIVGNARIDTRFGQGEDGEIYVLNKRNGVVYRLEEPSVPLPVRADAVCGSSPYVGVRAVPGAITVGFRFTVGPRNLRVDALGVWDHLGDGLEAAHYVGLWDAGGTRIARREVAAGDAAPLQDSFRYRPLVNQRTLLAGQTYTIAALYGGGTDPFNDAFDPDGDGSFQQVGSGIAIVLGRGIASIDRNVYAPLSTLEYPQNNGEGPLARWVGGNARIVPCDPGDWDCDGAVTADDASVLLEALAGPERAPAPAPPTLPEDVLDAFDDDADGDVDLHDVAAFQPRVM